jgi:hypothetical protein
MGTLRCAVESRCQFWFEYPSAYKRTNQVDPVEPRNDLRHLKQSFDTQRHISLETSCRETKRLVEEYCCSSEAETRWPAFRSPPVPHSANIFVLTAKSRASLSWTLHQTVRSPASTSITTLFRKAPDAGRSIPTCKALLTAA